MTDTSSLSEDSLGAAAATRERENQRRALAPFASLHIVPIARIDIALNDTRELDDLEFERLRLQCAKVSTPNPSRLGFHPVQVNNLSRNNREIERKFLVIQLPEKLKRHRHWPIEQGYLATEPAGRQVRVRKKGKTASLTFKVGRGAHREEREIRLSPKQFAALWPGTAGRRLRKVRYDIPWKHLLIEIDVYRGKHDGLVVAEVEFPDLATCRGFKPPFWFGREVTGEKRYSNVRLANE